MLFLGVEELVLHLLRRLLTLVDVAASVELILDVVIAAVSLSSSPHGTFIPEFAKEHSIIG